RKFRSSVIIEYTAPSWRNLIMLISNESAACKPSKALSAHPKSACEQDKHRHQLQASGEHEEREYPQGGIVDGREISDRADCFAKAGSDIGERGQRAGKGGHEIKAERC